MTEGPISGQDEAMPILAAVTPDAPPRSMPVAAPSFRRIFEEQHDFVWRSLVHQGVPVAHADDALQEVFLVVHRRLSDYDASAPLRGWLWGIARNVALNQRRSLGREARRQRELLLEPTATSDTSLLRAPELAAVREILVSMEEAFRDVLVLSDIEGMTAIEIAAVLELKVNTVYSRLRIARQRFTEAHFTETRGERGRKAEAREGADDER